MWSNQDINALLVDLQEAQQKGRKIVIAGVFNGRLSEGVDYAGGILDCVICVGIQNAPPSVFQKHMQTTSRISLDKATFGDMQIHSLQ